MKSLRTALINIRRMPYKSLIAVLMISITFFVAYSFSMLVLAAETTLHYFESKPKLIAFFDIKTSEQKIQQITKDIQEKTYVAEINLDSKEEALEQYREKQDNPLLLELVSADILPASLEAAATDPLQLPQIKQDLETYDEITDVVLYQDVIDNLNQWTKNLRLIGITLISVLGFVSLLIIITIISLKISAKKRSIGILRIIGASSGYIITPFIYEGFIYGLLGSAIGWGGMYAAFLYLQPWVKNFLSEVVSLPLPWEFFAIQAGIGTSIALFLGGFASIIAAKKLIKK